MRKSFLKPHRFPAIDFNGEEIRFGRIHSVGDYRKDDYKFEEVEELKRIFGNVDSHLIEKIGIMLPCKAHSTQCGDNLIERISSEERNGTYCFFRDSITERLETPVLSLHGFEGNYRITVHDLTPALISSLSDKDRELVYENVDFELEIATPYS